MLQMGVLADDLTGANDTGIQFHKAGLSSVVTLFRKDKPAKVPDCEAWIVDVKSRGIGAQTAYEWTRQISLVMKEASPRIIYKKIDSTLRGNIGAECEAVLDVFGNRILIVAPAFPQLGRTTKDGIQYLHGTPINQTELSRDPLSPVIHAKISDIIAVQSGEKSALIKKEHLFDVRLFREIVDRSLQKGIRIFIADAETDEDLDRLNENAGLCALQVVWVGSAGLASALARAFPAKSGIPGRTTVPGKQTLIVSGSQTELSHRQLEALSRIHRIQHAVFSAEELMEEEDATNLKGFQDALRDLQSGKHVIVSLAKKNDSNLRKLSLANGQDYIEAVRELTRKFGRAVQQMLEMNPGIGWLISIGGETSRGICDALETDSIRLMDEWLPGVIHGQCNEPEKLQIITKSGSFGDEHTLVQLVHKIGAFYE